MQKSDMLKSTQEERVLGTFVFFRYFFISWMAEFIIEFIWITKTELSLMIDFIFIIKIVIIIINYYTVLTQNSHIFMTPKKGVTIWVSVTIWIIATIWLVEALRIEGINSSIRIKLFVNKIRKIIF